MSLMIPLCNELQITVNELLSGCHIQENMYKEKAEENLVNILNEKQSNKRKIIIAFVVCFITLLSALTIILLSGLFEMQSYIRIILIVIAVIIMVLGIAVCCILDNSAGYFQCPHCNELFVPSMKAYIIGPHTLTKRQLKCPKCGKDSYCKKKLSK